MFLTLICASDADRSAPWDPTGVVASTKRYMHVGTNTGVVLSRRIAMAALLHRAYTSFWSSIVSLSDPSGVIRHDLSMYAIFLNGSGECNRGVQIHA